MDPNVFITIVFAGIAVLAALSGVVVAMRMRGPAGSKRGADSPVSALRPNRDG